MNNPLRLPRRRWLNRCVRGACLCLALAVVTTWLGATYDFPIDAAVVADMNAPECEPVRALQANSLLVSALPDSNACWPLFLYRASFPNAANDAASYRAWVLHQRVGEFWQLIGYVLVLWLIVLCGIVLVAVVVKRLVRRLHRAASSIGRRTASAPGVHRHRSS